MWHRRTISCLSVSLTSCTLLFSAVTVGDNYAPAVSQVLVDALTDAEFLRLPRLQLEVVNRGRERPSPYMSLMDFLFSAGTKSASQVVSIQADTPLHLLFCFT